MAHADRPTPSVAARARARALVGLVSHVTYPYLLGGSLGYLVLIVLNHDIGLMFAGALLVLYGAALSKAMQGWTEREGSDGTP